MYESIIGSSFVVHFFRVVMLFTPLIFEGWSMGHIAGFMETESLGAFIQTGSMFSCIRNCALGFRLQEQLGDTALRELIQDMQIWFGMSNRRPP